jgi:hypothetical protein
MSQAGQLDTPRLPRLGSSGLILAFRKLGPIGLFGLLPAAFVSSYLGVAIMRGWLGVDYRYSFFPAGRAVLHGRSPYPPLDPAVLARAESYVYPPLVSIVIAPFSLLPVQVATALAVTGTAAALAATLWVLGVRDWRCYGLSLLLEPVLSCIQTAAISGFLALGLALAWRARASGWRTPVLIAAVIAAKLFLVPVLVWLALVRGLRCAALTAAGALAIVVGPWLLGFPGLRTYPRLLSMLTDVEGDKVYALRALVHIFGAGWTVSQGIALLAGCAALAAAVFVAFRLEGERTTLGLAILAALLASPIVWPHYQVLLLLPIAIARPRLHWLWATPLVLWVAGHAGLRGDTVSIAASVAIVVCALVLGGGSRPAPAAA